jgi:prolyl-tRNA synthetase
MIKKTADKIYNTLTENNIEVLFDDRAGLSAGEKFADSDLLGIPFRAVISPRSIKEGGIELKKAYRRKRAGRIVGRIAEAANA